VPALLACLLLALQIVPQPPASTSLISTSSDDLQSNGISVNSSVSDDGRYVAFESKASDLVPNDTNAFSDVFLRDRLLGTTVRLSVTTAGAQVPKGGILAALSGDGTKLGFVSESAGIVAGDTNQKYDVFVRDLASGAILVASISMTGGPANEQSGPAMLSRDGSYVVFASRASDLVAGDDNDVPDIFVRDVLLGVTTRVSVASDGAQANDASIDPAISPDGRYVVFASLASNLVTGDTNLQIDVFVHDRLLGTTELVSRAADGSLGNQDSSFGCISEDGRYVGFQSRASNFVAGDGNDITDVFVKDRLTGAVELISATPSGGVPTESSDSPDLSADGRFVAFGSLADNLVPGGAGAPAGPGDHHVDHEIFLRDRLTGITRQISITPAGNQPDEGSINPQMTPDAALIAFETYATNIVAGNNDTNAATDVVAWALAPWTDLQGGLAGVSGVPQLTGEGLLLTALPTSIQLADAAPLAPALIVASLQSVPAPYKGGTILAFPWLVQLPLVTSAGGGIALGFPWPEGVPAGLTFWFQALVLDAGAVQGVAISTGLGAVTP
jgi:Tol biopolymer transport system component